jgi:16S rRNA (adenine1518-N6/adenine1519-N6)-dimethyltransferase
MKNLGQHFLKNPALIQKIVAALDIQSGETIIEIGPGHGELTISLAEVCKSIGAKIITIEKDEKLATALRAKNIDVISGDALLEIPALSGVAPAFKIVGNIPYYITGHLLRVISELETKPERSILMIQAEVAVRIISEAPRMNRLAASVQFWAEPKIIAHVSKTDFSPPPEVDSAVIKLDIKRGRSQRNDESYYAAVRAIFAQPRKTILNNLAASLSADKNNLVDLMNSINIDPKARPQNLTIENIARIAEAFFK